MSRGIDGCVLIENSLIQRSVPRAAIRVLHSDPRAADGGKGAILFFMTTGGRSLILSYVLPCMSDGVIVIALQALLLALSFTIGMDKGDGAETGRRAEGDLGDADLTFLDKLDLPVIWLSASILPFALRFRRGASLFDYLYGKLSSYRSRVPCLWNQVMNPPAEGALS